MQTITVANDTITIKGHDYKAFDAILRSDLQYFADQAKGRGEDILILREKDEGSTAIAYMLKGALMSMNITPRIAEYT